MSQKKIRISGDKNSYLSASQGYKKTERMEGANEDENDIGWSLKSA